MKNKKRRTDFELDQDMGLKTELDTESDGEEYMNVGNDTNINPKEYTDLKNVIMAG